MAIFHLHSQYIGRSGGRSAVAASAYRSASKVVEEIVDKATGYKMEVVHDYRNKDGVVFSQVIAPENSAPWMIDREKLWNSVQNEFDIRSNSVFAGEKDIALPVELNQEQNTELVKDFINEVFTKDGIIADVNIHYDNEKNPHFHVMTSTREIVWDESLGAKGEYTFGQKLRYLDSKEFLINLRRVWAGCINKHLKLHGIDKEVSHLSFKALGIDLMPGIKEGVGRKILGSDRGQINSKISQVNLTRISENPELIIDVLRKDKAVFTKDDISNALIEFVRENEFLSRDSLKIENENLEIGNENGRSGNVDNLMPESTSDEMQRVGKYISDLSKVLESEKVVCLGSKDVEGRVLYTSKVRYELEKDLIGIMETFKYGAVSDASDVGFEVKKDHSLDVSIEDIDNKGFIGKALKSLALTKDMPLSDKQKEVVLGVLNGTNISVVEGLPGSGKTTVMKEMARQYKKAGYEVIGTAVSSSAAMELGKKAGIMALNTTKFRYELEYMRGMIEGSKDFNVNLRMDYYKDYFKNVGSENIHKTLLSNKTVLIVDEASTVDLTELHFILREAHIAGSKVILLGDRAQQGSCGIEGGLEKAADIFGVLRLDEVRRQKNPEHQIATKLLSDYKVSDAIRLYRDKGVFDIAPSMDEARNRLVSDYVKHYTSLVRADGTLDNSIIALSYTNEEVIKLNSSIRARLKDVGIVYDESFSFTRSDGKITEFAKGDKVVFDKNDNYLEIANGDTGLIIGLGESKDGLRKTLIVKLEREEKYLGRSVQVYVEVDNKYYNSLSYGYALTIAKSQGRTWNTTFGLMDSNTGYNAFNVMCTRHEDDLKIYASGAELMDVLYKRVDHDVERARREWFIYARKDKDEYITEDIEYAGLSAIAYKRGDRSLLDDYLDLDDIKQAKTVVSKYIELRSEVLKLHGSMYAWLKDEKLKEKYGKSEIAKEKEAEFYKDKLDGKIGNDEEWKGLQIYHHPLYSELGGLIEERNEQASILYNNYPSYIKTLTQTNINFATVEKHAGMSSFEFKIKKNLPDSKIFGEAKDTNEIRNILSSLTSISKYEVGNLFDGAIFKDNKVTLLLDDIHQKTNSLLKLYEERRLNIEELNIELVKISHEKSRCNIKIIEAGEYVDNSIKLFLSRTYKDDPDKIIAKWQELKESSKAEDKIADSLSIIEKNPQVLGGLKGIGLGSILAFSKTRFRATVNMYEVVNAFKKYEGYKEVITSTDGHLGILDKASKDITSSVKALEKGLVGSALENFIQEINKVSAHCEDSASRVKHAILWTKNIENSEKIGLYEEILSPREANNIDASSVVGNAATGENHNQKTQLPLRTKNSISFDDVVSKIGASEYEALFRKYAPVINPDKRIEKKGSSISCGSLGMDLKTGLWHRFSTGEGGNVFGLVRNAEGISKYESLLKVASDLGINGNTNFVSLQNTKTKLDSKIQKSKNEWVAYNEIPKNVTPFEVAKHLRFMLDKKSIGGVYEYKDIDGAVRGYTVRFVSKEDGSKEVLPVSYCNNPVLKKDSWKLKGFDDGKGGKPIYGLEYLKEHPDKPVLIVEGEKTANKARELLPQYNVISWLGGSQNADKVDWNHIHGREVAIWPDNDRPGMICAKKIAWQINNNVDIASIVIINPDRLEFDNKVHENLLPAKWDLADSLPEGIDLDNIKEAISNSIKSRNNLANTHQTIKEFTHDNLQRHILQQKYLGLDLSGRDIKEIDTKYAGINKVLSSPEVESYVSYSKEKGIFETSHEFLQLEHKLYKESLVSIAQSRQINYESLNQSEYISEFSKIEEVYNERLANFTDHLDVIKPYREALSRAPAKLQVFEIYTRDALLLHKLQLEESLGKDGAYLSEKHKESIAARVYEIVKDAKLGSKNDIAPNELNKLQNKVFETICSSKLWVEALDTKVKQKAFTLDIDKQSSDLTNIEKNQFNQIYQEIKELKDGQDLGKLKAKIESLPNLVRLDVLKQEWVESFKKYVSGAKEEFVEGTSKSKDLGELANVIESEYSKITDKCFKYKDVLSECQKLDSKFDLGIVKNKDDIESLKIDAKNAAKLNIRINYEELDKFKEKEHKELPNNVFKYVRDSVTSLVIQNIDEIAGKGSVEIKNQTFKDPLSYLEHEMEKREIDRYLDTTNIPGLLESMLDEYGDSFKELLKLNPKYSLGRLQAKIILLDDEKRQRIMIDQLAKQIKPHIENDLITLQETKDHANTFSEFGKALRDEASYSIKLCGHYFNAAKALKEEYEVDHILEHHALHLQNPKYLDNLKQDVDSIESLDIKISTKKLESIKDCDNVSTTADKLFDITKSHVIKNVEHNTQQIYDKGFLKIGNNKFKSSLAYIKYEMETLHHDRYLKNTDFAAEYHVMKDYCKEHKISDHEFIRARELDRGLER